VFDRCAGSCPWADGTVAASIVVMPARAPSTHVVAAGGRRDRTVWGEPTSTAVTAEQTGGAFTVAAMTLRVGWRRRPYVHHRLDECFVVLAGLVRFSIEDREHPVVAAPGDVVYVPRGHVRSAEVAGAGPARVMLLQTPAPAESPIRPAPDVGWLEGVELVDT
jgi:mannose-6-phosphate isomerase-like protein (cupin superfamily)